MLNQNHPDDERLSALASHDTDASADDTLTVHVASCERCGNLVADLGALRASLADLPDIQPPRPLRLLPPVEAESSVDRVGGWVRRFFAPALAAGAALAVIGSVGTASPDMFQDVGTDLSGGGDAAMQEMAAESEAAGEPAAAEASANAFVFNSDRAVPDDSSTDEGRTASVPGQERAAPGALAERSPWPMVLFAGIALIVAALVLRWILVPRAG